MNKANTNAFSFNIPFISSVNIWALIHSFINYLQVFQNRLKSWKNHAPTQFGFYCFRHTKEMIKKLESAGLGYHVSADETEDKLGDV